MSAARHNTALERLFDGRQEVRMPLDDEQLRGLPARRGVFCLADRAGRCVLLATAANIRGRLRGRLEESHGPRPSRSADLRAVTRRVYWKLAASHFETDWRYLEIARAIWPRRYPAMLSWKPAWFVGVDPAERYPHFARTRAPAGPPGWTCVGPFETARRADEFIEAIQDAFDLCRDVQRLRRSPNAARCAYGQMGRCLCACDGTVGLADYRRAVARAAAFAAGDRAGYLAELRRRMRAAAEALEFE
ncbi:MAG: hypothetical protein J7M21_02850, partial [Planctomycetes bacterium]|nr:hypothetical protein [Planctomycetota bacterium]